eukprot:14888835-Ditylum_brightwellii.AAC.1
MAASIPTTKTDKPLKTVECKKIWEKGSLVSMMMGSNQKDIVSKSFAMLQHGIILEPRPMQRFMVVVLEHWPSW